MVESREMDTILRMIYNRTIKQSIRYIRYARTHFWLPSALVKTFDSVHIETLLSIPTLGLRGARIFPQMPPFYAEFSIARKIGAHERLANGSFIARFASIASEKVILSCKVIPVQIRRVGCLAGGMDRGTCRAARERYPLSPSLTLHSSLNGIGDIRQLL